MKIIGKLVEGRAAIDTAIVELQIVNSQIGTVDNRVFSRILNDLFIGRRKPWHVGSRYARVIAMQHDVFIQVSVDLSEAKFYLARNFNKQTKTHTQILKLGYLF